MLGGSGHPMASSCASCLVESRSWSSSHPSSRGRRSPFLSPSAPSIRTLDALHLASAEFLRGQGHPVVLASYDERLIAAAAKLGFSIYEGSDA